MKTPHRPLSVALFLLSATSLSTAVEARQVILTKKAQPTTIPTAPADPATITRVFDPAQGKTLAANWSEIQDGDTVQLACGDHGNVLMEKASSFTKQTTIIGARNPDGTRCANLGQTYIYGTSYLTVKGLTFRSMPSDQGLPRNHPTVDGGGQVVSITLRRNIPVANYVQAASGMRFTTTVLNGETVITGDGSALSALPKISNIVFEDNDVASTDDISDWTQGTVTWGKNTANTAYVPTSNFGTGTWNTKPWVGLVTINADNSVIKNNVVKNGRKAIQAVGTNNVTITGNQISDITVDGIEWGGENVLIDGNTMLRSRDHAGEWLHADCIQGYGGPSGVGRSVSFYQNATISNNVCKEGPYAAKYSYTDTDDTDGIPNKTYNTEFALQGIDTFDGRWRNVNILNNYIEVTAYQGLTWFNGDGITVTGNTLVLSPEATDWRKTQSLPWLEVGSSKPGEGLQLPWAEGYPAVVANNVVPGPYSLRMMAPGPYVVSPGTGTIGSGGTYTRGTGYVQGQSTITFDPPGDGFAAMTGTVTVWAAATAGTSGSLTPVAAGQTGTLGAIVWDTAYNKPGAKYGHYTGPMNFTLGGPGSGATVVVRWLPEDYYQGWDNFAAQNNRQANGTVFTAPAFTTSP